MKNFYGSSPSLPARQPDEAILAGAGSWLKIIINVQEKYNNKLLPNP